MKTILLLSLLLTGSFTAWNIHEKEECRTWHQDAMEHHISVERWQIDQCAAHDMSIVNEDSYTYVGHGRWTNMIPTASDTEYLRIEGAHFENDPTSASLALP